MRLTADLYLSDCYNYSIEDEKSLYGFAQQVSRIGEKKLIELFGDNIGTELFRKMNFVIEMHNIENSDSKIKEEK